MNSSWISLFLIMLVTFSTQASELRGLAGSNEDFKYDSFFEMDMQERNGQIDLLSFQETTKKFPLPRNKYDRLQHFGTWVDDHRDNSCLNTRAKVLERDSKVAVSFGGARGCTVTKGEWLDPYTGQLFRGAIDVQIDHLVPLKHAYMTGGFEWDRQHRCLYANFLGNKFHLVSASARQNEEKGDKSPAEYLPPRKSYVCQYIANWLKVKAIWKLRLTPTEVDRIRQEVDQNSCQANAFQMRHAELQSQLNFIENNLDLCSN